MWGQLITMRVKPGREDDLTRMLDEIRAAEQGGSGLLRSTAMQDQKDPTRVLALVMFESEEAARARESDPRREEALRGAMATMAEILDGPPEFVDLAIVDEVVY